MPRKKTTSQYQKRTSGYLTIHEANVVYRERHKLTCNSRDYSTNKAWIEALDLLVTQHCEQQIIKEEREEADWITFICRQPITCYRKASRGRSRDDERRRDVLDTPRAKPAAVIM
jgi:hypothetical protein